MATTQEADAAKLTATQRIEEARRSGVSELNLSDLDALDQLPALDGLPELRTLNLNGTKINDLKPLSGLFGLEHLILSSTTVDDVSPLSNLHRLRILGLQGTHVTDASPLSTLVELVDLDLSGTAIEDISPLGGLTHLRRLDLTKTKVSDISPVRTLTGLTELKLWRVPVSDFSAITKLTSLRRLVLWDTNIDDLSIFAEMTQLEYLDVDGTKVSDLSPLSDFSTLSTLYFSGTNVSDLSPLAKRATLRVLGCAQTPVSDLRPLAQLKDLHILRIEGTKVSDLTPLADLRLSWLDISDTRVTDLAPIVQAIDTSDKPELGLTFAGCPLADPVLIDLGKKDNPERTIEVINYLRRQQRLPPSKPGPKATLPDLPEQGPGPHFVLSDQGIVSFAPPGTIDAQGNNILYLRALHPELRELAHVLVDGLRRGNVPHATLLERAERYLSLIDNDLQLVPFARLYVEGVRLQNAWAASSEEIAEGELPGLEVAAREALQSLLHLHGTFMLSTADGLALLAAEERYERRPQEEQELRDAAVAFAEELQGRPDIIDPRAAEFILKAAEEVGRGTNLERSAVIATGTTKNAAIVVAAGATLGALPVIGGLVAGPAGLVGGGLAALVGVEGLKKSKSFLTISTLVTRGLDHLTEEGLQELLIKRAGQLAPYVGFVLKVEPVLRRLTKDRRQFDWLSGLLDWLTRHAKHDDKTV